MCLRFCMIQLLAQASWKTSQRQHLTPNCITCLNIRNLPPSDCSMSCLYACSSCCICRGAGTGFGGMTMLSDTRSRRPKALSSCLPTVSSPCAILAIWNAHANDSKVCSFECRSRANKPSFGRTLRTSPVYIGPSESTPQNDCSRATIIVPVPFRQIAPDRVSSLRHRFGKRLRQADCINIMASNELARALEPGCPHTQPVCLCIPVQDFHRAWDLRRVKPRAQLEIAPSDDRSCILSGRHRVS